MKAFDLFVIIFIGLATIRGFIRGAIREIFSILGIIAGIVLAGKYYVGLSSVFSFVKNPTLRSILAFAVLFLLIYILFTLFGTLIKKLFNILLLSFFDHLAGAILGFLEGLFFIGVVLILLSHFGVGQSILSESPWALKVYDSVNHLFNAFLKGFP